MTGSALFLRISEVFLRVFTPPLLLPLFLKFGFNFEIKLFWNKIIFLHNPHWSGTLSPPDSIF